MLPSSSAKAGDTPGPEWLESGIGVNDMRDDAELVNGSIARVAYITSVARSIV